MTHKIIKIKINETGKLVVSAKGCMQIVFQLFLMFDYLYILELLVNGVY